MQPVVFIARLVGPLFVVLGIGCLLNQQVYADMIGQAVLVPVLIYLSGLMAFLAGVAMLNGYHAWTADWRVIITILGWLLVIAGIIRIVLPAAAAVAAMRSIRAATRSRSSASSSSSSAALSVSRATGPPANSRQQPQACMTAVMRK